MPTPSIKLVAAWLLLALAAPTAARGEEGQWTAASRPQPSRTQPTSPGLLEPANNARPLTNQQRRATPAPSRSRSTEQAGVAPSAILIRNPNTASGEPPFALADEYGRIQRFVEPANGINLAGHVGQMVSVRHDTGRTLLASQLAFNVQGLPTSNAASRSPAPPSPVVGNLAFPAPQPSPSYGQQQPVIITQFGEGEAETKPLTPEPIVLEEIIGDPVVQPIEGLPLPPSDGLPRLTLPVPPATPAAVPHAGVCHGPACRHSPDPDIYFEAELLLLRMFDSDAMVTNDDYETGSRFTLGVRQPNGNHWAIRYLEYENENYNVGNANPPNTLQLELFDFEYGRCFDLGCNWQGLWTIGGRFADFEQSNGVIYDTTFGPVAGVQVQGPCWGHLHPMFGLRHSLQAGDAAAGYGAFNMTEIAAGLEYQRALNSGGAVFGRAAVETILLDGPLQTGPEDASLIGIGLSLGIVK